MKKIIASLMLAGSVLGGLAAPALSASASVVKEDSTQTVVGQQDAQVEFKGQIGELDPATADPTDPDAPKPGTDWIKVKLPTKVVYYSTAESKHKTIDSGDYKITNESVYPVDVKLTGFKGEDGKAQPNIDKVQSLALKAGGTTIDLVKGAVAQEPNASIFKLGVDSKKENRQDTTGLSQEGTFKISGATTEKANLSQRTILNNKLDITLVGLDKAGEVPAAK
ncbi:hypothetical protein [Lactococcus petauri]|uniref:hypothetical protein n=1 Tax=Lactococcus petauri TaxID=1940789 RepID=UPI001F59A88B|nr:hypothetical protein [Lactococcus petauri]